MLRLASSANLFTIRTMVAFQGLFHKQKLYFSDSKSIKFLLGIIWILCVWLTFKFCEYTRNDANIYVGKIIDLHLHKNKCWQNLQRQVPTTSAFAKVILGYIFLNEHFLIISTGIPQQFVQVWLLTSSRNQLIMAWWYLGDKDLGEHWLR